MNSILAYFLSFCIHLHCLLCVWVVCRMPWRWHLANSKFSFVHCVRLRWVRSLWFQYSCTLVFFGAEVWTTMIFWLLIENLRDSVCFERHCSAFLLCLSECRFEQISPRTWFIAFLACDKALVIFFSLVQLRCIQFDADFLCINFSADVLRLTHRVHRSHCYVLTIMFIYVYILIECSIQNGGDKKFHSWREQRVLN